MLDDLRAQASDMTFEDDEVEDIYSYKEQVAPTKGPLLGMTAPQRFVIAFMVLLMTCILGAFFLLVTEKVWLPFLS